MEVVNNDKAGILLISPGDFIRVSEDDEGAVILAALTSQPTSDVILTAEEVHDDINPKQLNNFGEIRFTSENWFAPQPLSISAINDGIIEDRIKDSHELVRYDNFVDPYDENLITDSLPFRIERKTVETSDKRVE